jgi:UDPglucose 6-dehydrogenase
VGTGTVGLVTGVVLADIGNDVVCVDNDADKLEKLRNGVSPILELGVDELLRSTTAVGFSRVSDSIAEGTRNADRRSGGRPSMDDQGHSKAMSVG